MLEKTTKPTDADNALGDALLGKLRELAALRPTVRSLMQLEHTARLAREILVAAVDPFALKRNKFAQIQSGMQLGNVGNVGGLDGDMLPYSGGDIESAGYINGPVGSSYAENFGANVIRELAATKGETAETRALDLVAAISFCREKGMNDLAGKLEDTLLEAVGREKPPTPGLAKAAALPAPQESPEAAQ